MQSTTVRYPRLDRAIALSILVLLATVGPVQAHDFCVANATQLQNALTAASDGGAYGGESNFIYLVQGTYKTGAATSNGPFHYTNSTMSVHFIIYGGYDATCTTQSLKPSLTVLDGNHASQVLVIHSADGPVTVGYLTIQNGESAEDGGGLLINPVFNVNTDNSTVSVIDNIIQNNHTTGSGGGGLVKAGTGAHVMFFQHNLIVGNSADITDGAMIVVGLGSQTLLTNNTVTQNSVSQMSAVGGLDCHSNGVAPCTLYNNIFWNNTNVGLYLASSNADVEYNDYGTLGGATPDTSQANVSVAPKFVNANAGDFHLASDSPLLGTSPLIFGNFDLDGNHVPSDGRMDLGAYEETIFTDGFGS